MSRTTECWTKELESISQVSGCAYRDQFGFYSGHERAPYWLEWRQAIREYTCKCGATIAKGEMHGSAPYCHRCADCVTFERPASQFRPKGKEEWLTL